MLTLNLFLNNGMVIINGFMRSYYFWGTSNVVWENW